MMGLTRSYAPIYDKGMRKTADVELSDIRIPILDTCPNCKGPLKCSVLIGVGQCRPQVRYCDACGHTKNIAKVPAHG